MKFLLMLLMIASVSPIAVQDKNASHTKAGPPMRSRFELRIQFTVPPYEINTKISVRQPSAARIDRKRLKQSDAIFNIVNERMLPAHQGTYPVEITTVSSNGTSCCLEGIYKMILAPNKPYRLRVYPAGDTFYTVTLVSVKSLRDQSNDALRSTSPAP